MNLAIAVLKRTMKNFDIEDDPECQMELKAYQDIRDGIKEEPTIEPEQKSGKWVGYDGDWLKTMCKCSECGAMIDINEKYRNFFCYHCGARMDGEQNERFEGDIY